MASKYKKMRLLASVVLVVMVGTTRSMAITTRSSVAATLPSGACLPRLVVFDLDRTLWLPELYQLRLQKGATPVAWKDVRLLPGAEAALRELTTCECWQGTQIGVASRTHKGEWARSLLAQFLTDDGRPLAEVVSFQEIYTGSKLRHFEALRERSGVAYEDMLFYDDALDGKYGNCVPIAQLGCCAAHCPDGLTAEVWRDGVLGFAAHRASDEAGGAVVDAGGSVRPMAVVEARAEPLLSAPQPARVFKWVAARSFGFVRLAAGGKEVFFHRSALPGGASTPRVGDAVVASLRRDGRGRLECGAVRPSDGGAGAVDGDASVDASAVTLPVFSMNLPFAALVAHGRKTLETRNHTMFEGTEGRLALLHVGQRTYPDGGKHRDILRSAGASDAEIDRLVALPAGFARGVLVAVLELGTTRLAEDAERATDEVQSAACALGGDMGRYLTEVRRVAWLREPVRMRGKPGLFSASVPRGLLPDGWDVDAA